ncbi:MAG: deoxyribose-phosphate aldolase [Bifidobacteriaceae bacterium]|jgi:deoxyribose-phosphate aldolase|nr:deoxyribose-phosphate aldolase [Bifidobacteriaceae bacterium]
METSNLFKYIDHTLLKPTSNWDQINKICEEALQYHTASACIVPSYVERAHQEYPNLNICTVIGFPLGYNDSSTKAHETETMLKKGANEIDMVMNICEFKNQNFEYVTKEIQTLKKICEKNLLKVIVETAYLDDDEIITITKLVSDSGADFIKTSTGFASRGASFEDVEVFAKYKSPTLKIKAAGGISSVDDMEKFIKLGAARLGTSSGIKLILGQTQTTSKY